MHRYFFNFRKGDELAIDRRGMWLPSDASAQREAIQLWGALVAVAMVSGDPPEDCEYEVANGEGNTVVKLPLGCYGSMQ